MKITASSTFGNGLAASAFLPSLRGVERGRSSACQTVSSHRFRKTVATLIDDPRPSARIGADHLGHAKA